jgi:hypothetical protein
MAKIKNKKTGVVKDIEKEFEVSMYLGTGEWELVVEKEAKPLKTPIIDTKDKEDKK